MPLSFENGNNKRSLDALSRQVGYSSYAYLIGFIHGLASA